MDGDMDAMEFLIELILNNTQLNYDKNKLTIRDDNVVLEVLKVLAKAKYENRLQELQEKENNKKEN